ncbi:MAG: hypothetical protein JNM71_04455 [Flavobacterium lindanitolerans]|nr:hypothetical protein [Flavobacterium lindanitolerans]
MSEIKRIKNIDVAEGTLYPCLSG